jgi:anti-anti-sigma factor
MASTGVSALMNAYRRASAAGSTLVVASCGRAVERILEISGVLKLLTGLDPADRAP